MTKEFLDTTVSVETDVDSNLQSKLTAVFELWKISHSFVVKYESALLVIKLALHFLQGNSEEASNIVESTDTELR